MVLSDPGGTKLSCPCPLVSNRRSTYQIDTHDRWPWRLRGAVIPILVFWTYLCAFNPTLSGRRYLLEIVMAGFLDPREFGTVVLRFLVSSFPVARGSFRVPIKQLYCLHFPLLHLSFNLFFPTLYIPNPSTCSLRDSFSDNSKMKQEHNRCSAPTVPVSWLHAFHERRPGADLMVFFL